MTGEEAIVRARDAAKPTRADIDAFETELTEHPSHWMVRFVRPGATHDGAGQHLAVRVDKETGEARVFHGR
jgi:hypothetical protein